MTRSGYHLTEIGLYNYLGKQRDTGRLHELAGDDSSIHCIFICCDLPYQYLDDYFTKLGEEYFHPLQNNVSSPQYLRYNTNVT